MACSLFYGGFKEDKMHKIIKRLQEELSTFETELHESTAQQVMDNAYRLVCYRELVATADVFVPQLSSQVRNWLMSFSNEESLLEQLYQFWIKDDNSFASEMWSGICYRVEHSCKTMRGF